MCPTPNDEAPKSEVLTTRVPPWLYSGVNNLAKFQGTSASAKAAKYIEDGFRRELEEINFEEELAAERTRLEELSDALKSSHEAALASFANRKSKTPPKDN